MNTSSHATGRFRRRLPRTLLMVAVLSLLSVVLAVPVAESRVPSGAGGFGETSITCLYRGKVRVTVSISGDRYRQMVGAAVQIYNSSARRWDVVFPFTTQVVNDASGYQASTATWSFTMSVPTYSRSWFWTDYRWYYAGYGWAGSGEMPYVDC